MSWVAITVDPSDNEVNIDWLYLMKIVLSTVRGVQLLYIILEVRYQCSSYCYSNSLVVLRSPLLRVFFLFYIILLLHLYPPRVD